MKRDPTLRKPLGGYVQVSTQILGLLAWSYSEGLLSLRGVRVGLALFELRIRRAVHALIERRKGRTGDFTPRLSTKELEHLRPPPEAGKGRVKRAPRARHRRRVQRDPFHLHPFARLSLRSPRSNAWPSGAWFAALTKRNKVPVPRRILALACRVILRPHRGHPRGLSSLLVEEARRDVLRRPHLVLVACKPFPALDSGRAVGQRTPGGTGMD